MIGVNQTGNSLAIGAYRPDVDWMARTPGYLDAFIFIGAQIDFLMTDRTNKWFLFHLCRLACEKSGSSNMSRHSQVESSELVDRRRQQGVLPGIGVRGQKAVARLRD